MRQKNISYDDCQSQYDVGSSTVTLIMRRYHEQKIPLEELCMAVERIPGERVYIDWIGDQPELLVDPETGELRKAHFFVTTVGVSSMIYAEAFPDEKLHNFISGTVHALAYYEASPKYLVPDNLRAAITKHTKDELVVNSAYQDLEQFYDVIVLPPLGSRRAKPP